ncbi:MAG: metallophosphoesterase [Planctomycetota bacterium]|nr:metallophosphoesterase [Planctomycetota bacterium]MDP6941389.1 metallophosphoesterase [Planctomycetota bacterium]
MKKRGIFVLAAALVLIHGLDHGLRFPPLQFDPTPISFSGEVAGLEVIAEGAFLRKDSEGVVLRAFTPEPTLSFYSEEGWRGQVLLENTHPEARFENNPFLISREDLAARLEVNLPAGESATVQLRFPTREKTRFAVIGDTGGRGESAWGFRRAAELGADFVLHLGDISYSAADFPAAAITWNKSPIPVYTAIGNHDFRGHVDSPIQFFQEHFGPLNGFFELNGAWFLNLDTAADTVPAWGGERGKTLERFSRIQRKEGVPLFVWTHRPLADPRVQIGERSLEDAHALNRRAEARWLRNQLVKLGATTLFAGHIHQSFDFEDQGLRTFIAGEGLGANGEASKILICEWSANHHPTFRFEPLNMPPSSHGPETTPR